MSGWRWSGDASHLSPIKQVCFKSLQRALGYPLQRQQWCCGESLSASGRLEFKPCSASSTACYYARPRLPALIVPAVKWEHPSEPFPVGWGGDRLRPGSCPGSGVNAAVRRPYLAQRRRRLAPRHIVRAARRGPARRAPGHYSAAPAGREGAAPAL